MKKRDIQSLHAKFGNLFEVALLEELVEFGNYMEVDEGFTLMKPGGYIRTVPILLSGSVKILRADSEGREVLLYYLCGLDSGAMSLLLSLSLRVILSILFCRYKIRSIGSLFNFLFQNRGVVLMI